MKINIPLEMSVSFSWSHPTKISVWRQNWGFPTHWRKCWWACEEGFSGCCYLYSMVLVGWVVSLFKGRGKTKDSIRTELIDFSFLFFLHAAFARQIKNITCSYLKWNYICKWFSVDKQHWKNPEGKQRKGFLFVWFVFLWGILYFF